MRVAVMQSKNCIDTGFSGNERGLDQDEKAGLDKRNRVSSNLNFIIGKQLKIEQGEWGILERTFIMCCDML